MDDELFAALYQVALQLWPGREKRVQCPQRTVMLMFLWSAIRNKPRYWVCQRKHLPLQLQHQAILGRSQFGRRISQPNFKSMLAQLYEHLGRLPRNSLLGCWLIDAKPLLVSPYSKDKEAKWGWAYSGKARGYKLFAMTDLEGRFVAWQTRPMNESEPSMARQLLQKTDRPGYLLGDSAYDSGPLHELALSRELQLLAPRKEPHGNIGQRARQPSRLHAIDMLETFNNAFGPSLYACRTGIERAFSRLACSHVGLDRLPGFVRSPPRVSLWVDAKIILYCLLQNNDLQQ